MTARLELSAQPCPAFQPAFHPAESLFANVSLEFSPFFPVGMSRAVPHGEEKEISVEKMPCSSLPFPRLQPLKEHCSDVFQSNLDLKVTFHVCAEDIKSGV